MGSREILMKKTIKYKIQTVLEEQPLPFEGNERSARTKTSYLIAVGGLRLHFLLAAVVPWVAEKPLERATVRRTSQILDYTPINNRNPDPPRGVGKFWISIIGVSGSESRSQRFHHLRLARGYGWLSLAGRESETSTTNLPSPRRLALEGCPESSCPTPTSAPFQRDENMRWS